MEERANYGIDFINATKRIKEICRMSRSVAAFRIFPLVSVVLRRFTSPFTQSSYTGCLQVLTGGGRVEFEYVLIDDHYVQDYES